MLTGCAILIRVTHLRARLFHKIQTIVQNTSGTVQFISRFHTFSLCVFRTHTFHALPIVVQRIRPHSATMAYSAFLRTPEQTAPRSDGLLRMVGRWLDTAIPPSQYDKSMAIHTSKQSSLQVGVQLHFKHIIALGGRLRGRLRHCLLSSSLRTGHDTRPVRSCH